MVRWMAPVMSFTAQEIWESLPARTEQFVFTGVWYEALNDVPTGQVDDAFWQQLLLVRDEVNRVIESVRKEGKIGASLQAEVTLFAQGELADTLKRLADELRFVLITSTATVETSAAPADAIATAIAGLSVQVHTSTAAKCDRCWHHRHDVGANPAHPLICLRCVSNVEGEGEPRIFA
jgi:isoleucyl-tRNA synthetase